MGAVILHVSVKQHYSKTENSKDRKHTGPAPDILTYFLSLHSGSAEESKYRNQVLHAHDGILFSPKKEGSPVFYNNMDRTGDQ